MSAAISKPEPVDMPNDAHQHPSVILVATEGDWAGRSLESVLVAQGFAEDVVFLRDEDDLAAELVGWQVGDRDPADCHRA